MKTTLTIDDDVAATLTRLHKTRGGSFKDLVNETLRAGLRTIHAPRRRKHRAWTRPADLGPSLLGGVDNVAEVLAVAEGESYRL